MGQEKICIKSFDELTTLELYKIIKTRIDIFVVEQVCPYPELDNLDQEAYHIWIEKQGEIAAYTRVLKIHGENNETYAIGRVLSQKSFRAHGYGRKILSISLAMINEKWPDTTVKVSAQLYLLNFYSSFGFKQYGEGYLEDGIPHISMKK